MKFVVATVCAVVLAGPAMAQSRYGYGPGPYDDSYGPYGGRGPWGGPYGYARREYPGPGYRGPDDDMGGLALSQIMRQVRAANLQPISRPHWTGTYYIVRALNGRGEVMRVALDARSARIVSISPIGGAQQFGELPRGSGSPPPAPRNDLQRGPGVIMGPPGSPPADGPPGNDEQADLNQQPPVQPPNDRMGALSPNNNVQRPPARNDNQNPAPRTVTPMPRPRPNIPDQSASLSPPNPPQAPSPQAETPPSPPAGPPTPPAANPPASPPPATPPSGANDFPPPAPLE